MNQSVDENFNRRFKSGMDDTSDGNDDDVEQKGQVTEDVLPLLWSERGHCVDHLQTRFEPRRFDFR
jgi:hypothetical protein